MKEKNLLIVPREKCWWGGGLVLLVVCHVLDAYPHEAGVAFPEVGLYLLLVLCFSSLDAFDQVRSGPPEGDRWSVGSTYDHVLLKSGQQSSDYCA